MSSDDPQDHLDTDHLKDDMGRRTVGGGLVTVGAQVSISVLEIAATLVLARLLMPEDFGLVGMVVAVTGFLHIFKDLGLSMATVQREEITHEQVSSLFWINVGVSALLMVITAALAPALAYFYGEPRLTMITLALAVAFIFSGLGVQHQAILQRQMRFQAYALSRFIPVVGSVALAIWLGWRGFGYWALVGQSVAAPLIGTVVVWIACGWRPSWPKRGTDVVELLKFGGNLTGFSIINHFARNLDDVLIGKFSGASRLGMYQKAYEILMVPLKQLNSPIRSIAISALSRLTGEPERYRRTFIRILEKILMLTMPLGALMIATADWIVLIVLGENWLEAADLFRALGIGVFTQPIGNATGWLFITQDRTDQMMRWGLIGSALAVTSFVVGLPWGALGVAVAYSVSGVLIRTPILLWFVGKEGPVKAKDFYKMAWPFALSAVATGAALYYFRTQWTVVVPEFVPASWTIAAPLLGLLAAIGISLVVSVAVLLVLPSGRAALFDLRTALKMLKKQDNDAQN